MKCDAIAVTLVILFEDETAAAAAAAAIVVTFLYTQFHATFFH